MHHFGVIKTLHDIDLLPRVIAGSSVGSLIGALLCTILTTCLAVTPPPYFVSTHCLTNFVSKHPEHHVHRHGFFIGKDG